MRKLLATTAAVAAAAATTVLLPTSAHALAADTLTLCAIGAHADVLVTPATTQVPTAGPASFSIARDTCSDLALATPGVTTTFNVSLAHKTRTPMYGPSTANDGGNFSFGEQPFDHITVKYTALPPGGMAYTTDADSVDVTIGQNRTSGAEVDFVFANQLH